MFGAMNAQTINPGYIDGHLYFKFNDDYDFKIKVNENTTVDFNQMPAEFTEMFQRYGVTLITRPLYVFNSHRLERIIRLEFTDAQNIGLFIKELEMMKDIEYAEMIPYRTRKVTYNDPLYTSQTYSGIEYNYRWHLEMINAPQAWGIQQGSANIKVAIVDNAVWGAHPDLQISSSNMCSFATGYASVGNSAPPSSVSQTYECTQNDLYYNNNCPAYDWSHGTHCAGLVGAINNNGVGISSIGGGVTLMGVRAANNNDELYYCDDGVAWAADNGAKVISMSYGSEGDSNSERILMQELYNEGVILVAAAGNEGDEGNPIIYPAGYSTVISVASVNSNGVLSSFSQHGTGRADVAAPGGYRYYNSQTPEYYPNILSTTYCKSQLLRIVGLDIADDQYYDGMQGTSMATPICAGLCGLLASAYPDITPAQAKECLISTGTALTSGSNTIDNNVYINAYAAVQCAQAYAGSSTLTVNPTSLNYAVSGGSQTVTVSSNTSWTATTTANWLTISPASGSNNGTFTVTASENTSASQRTATITVSGTDVSSRTITVTQAGASSSESCITANEEILEDESLVYSYLCSNGYTDYFTEYAQKIDVDGVYTLDKITLGGLYITATSNSVTLKVWSANNSEEPGTELYSQAINISTINSALTNGGGYYYGSYEHTLSSPITVTGPFFVGWDVEAVGAAGDDDSNLVVNATTYDNANSVLGNSLYVNYGGWSLLSTLFSNPPTNVAAAFLPHICISTTPMLTVDPTSLNYVAAGGSKTVNVTSNISWTATSSASWLTVSPTSGSNNGTITATATTNTSSSERTATITISGSGVTSQTISVTQAGAAQVVSEFTYDFEACTAWEVDNFAPCTTHDGDGSATYGIDGVNFTNSNYTGSFIAFQNGVASSFTAHGGTQFGCCMAAMTPPNNDWFITPPIAIQNGTEFSFWGKSATDQYGLEKIKVAISTNSSTFTTYLAGSASSSIEVPIEWTQYSYDLSQYAGQTMYVAIMCVSNDAFALFIDDIEISIQEEPTYNLSVNPTTLNYIAAGESKTVNVTSNTSWTATSSATWLTLSPASGSNNGTITAVASANTSTSERTATITVSGNGVTSQTISVTQAGATTTIDENALSGISVFPNPTNGMFTIDFGTLEGNVTYQFANVNGAVIEYREINVSESSSIMFDYNIAAGVYFVRIFNGEKVWTERIVVE